MRSNLPLTWDRLKLAWGAVFPDYEPCLCKVETTTDLCCLRWSESSSTMSLLWWKQCFVVFVTSLRALLFQRAGSQLWCWQEGRRTAQQKKDNRIPTFKILITTDELAEIHRIYWFPSSGWGQTHDVAPLCKNQCLSHARLEFVRSFWFSKSAGLFRPSSKRGHFKKHNPVS